MNPGSQICRRCVAALRQRSHPSNLAVNTVRRQHVSTSRSTTASRSASRHISTSHTKVASRHVSTRPSYTDFNGDANVNPGEMSADTSRELLKPNNLFHHFSSSPSTPLRLRAAYMKQHAYCPHPSHHRTRQSNGPADPEARKPNPGEAGAEDAQPPAHVRFECPDCGVPVYCCEEHYNEDFENHLEICDTLRQVNEDDHDLRSGRFHPEFNWPYEQRAEEFVINFSNWDTLLYTRDHPAVDDPRQLRQVTRLLTYPMTIASILNELSPYNLREGGRLTPEGLRSLSALRYTAHQPPLGGDGTIEMSRPKPPPIRIFVLGARAESSLPRLVWMQLAYCFPRGVFHIIFVGPESMANREHEFPLPEATPRNPFRRVVEDRISHQLKITTYVEYWHTLHQRGEFGTLDPYLDFFVLFHPGLGHPASSFEWRDTLPSLLESKCAIISTGYTDWDMQRDLQWVVDQTNGGPDSMNKGIIDELRKLKDDPLAQAALAEKEDTGEMDILLEPGENIFRSLRWDMNDLDPSDISCGNWGVWAFRGKRYEATTR